jgi:ferredoxin-NADP reductase
MKEELKEMLQEAFISLYTREKVMGFIGKRIDRKYLIEHITDFVQHFYICDSTEFVKKKSTYLMDLGANIDAVVFGKS